MEYSIVIPVYNAEQYIGFCLDNLLKQKASLEIVLVDDGSSDKSGVICDEYAAGYDNIKVIHTDNYGAGSARNTGADETSGKYLVFIDADDYISEDFFEKLETSGVDMSSDLIFFDTVKIFEDGSEIPMNQGFVKELIRGRTKSEVYDHISRCSKFPANICGKIINLDFYKRNGIRMPSGLVSEDVSWSFELMLKAESFDFFDGGFYYYRQVTGSRSAHGNAAAVRDNIIMLDDWTQRPVKTEYQSYFNAFFAYQYAMIFPFYGILPPEDKKQFFTDMKRFRYLLKYGRSRKLKAIRLAVLLLGINKSSELLYRYVKERDKS